MTRSRLVLLGSLVLAATLAASAVAHADAPRWPLEGRWVTYDPDTKKKDGIVEVFKKDGKFFGKLVWLANADQKDEKGDGGPLLGRLLLKGFSWDDDDDYEDGKIYNPRDGKDYSCKLEVKENGRKLKVRGFVGISMFGKTEYWTREE